MSDADASDADAAGTQIAQDGRVDVGPVRPPRRTDGLIDDLEDGDGNTRRLTGRAGAWYTINDGSGGGTQTPAPGAPFVPAAGGAMNSDYAARTAGSGFLRWGAAMGVELLRVDGAPVVYDATGYVGLEFHARGTGVVTVSLVTAATVPPGSGGHCQADCFDYHAVDLTLTDTWIHHEYLWSDLAQKGWGARAELDVREALAIEFEFGVDADFELVIDDLGLR